MMRMNGVIVFICDIFRRPPPAEDPIPRQAGKIHPAHAETPPGKRPTRLTNQRPRHGGPPPQTTVESNKQTHERNGGTAPPTTAETYTQAHERCATTTPPHPPKAWERFADDTYSIPKRTHPEILFHHINNLHQDVNVNMEEESNRELAFLDTPLKRNNGEISLLAYRLHTLSINSFVKQRIK